MASYGSISQKGKEKTGEGGETQDEKKRRSVSNNSAASSVGVMTKRVRPVFLNRRERNRARAEPHSPPIRGMFWPAAIFSTTSEKGYIWSYSLPYLVTISSIILAEEDPSIKGMGRTSPPYAS